MFDLSARIRAAERVTVVTNIGNITIPVYADLDGTPIAMGTLTVPVVAHLVGSSADGTLNIRLSIAEMGGE